MHPTITGYIIVTAVLLLSACSASPSDPISTQGAEVDSATSSSTTTTHASVVTEPAPIPPIPSGEATLAERASPLPPQPDGVPYPTTSWPTGEWPEGVDGVAVEEAIAASMQAEEGPRVRAVVVVQGGRLIYEAYSPSPNDGPNEVMPSFSISKSIASAALGVMVGDGLLAVDDPAAVDEWSDPADPRSAITLNQLLRMSSGLEWAEQDDRGVDLLSLLTVPDAAAYAADKPLVAAPGTVFNYSTGTSSIIARIMGETLGSPDELLRLVRNRIFDPLGIGTVTTRTDEAGTWLAGFSADMTAGDFAKFGLLYLRDGMWEGRRLLPEGWVDYTRSPSPTDATYGAHWRLEPDSPGILFARGFRGQKIIVDPRHDLVIVQLATERTVSDELAIEILDVFEAGPPAIAD